MVSMNGSLQALATPKYVNLATFRRNGVEGRTPVWMAALDGRGYVFSAGDAGKVKRIRATPRVRLAACNARGTLTGAWHDGSARTLDAAIARHGRGYEPSDLTSLMAFLGALSDPEFVTRKDLAIPDRACGRRL